MNYPNYNPSLNTLAESVHKTACDKGWWDEGIPREFGTLLALVHSEVSEALEAAREFPDFTPATERHSDHDKPVGVPSELADVIIRVLDICAAYGIDIDKAVDTKMAYNKTRAHRHGGKAF